MKKRYIIEVWDVASFVAIHVAVYLPKYFAWEYNSYEEFYLSVGLLLFFGISGIMMKFIYKLKWKSEVSIFSCMFIAYSIWRVYRLITLE